MSIEPHTTRSVEELIAAIEAGATPTYIFYWGHRPKVDGIADKSCLSNWYPSKFTVDGVTYKTGEHYMMAQKATLFGDVDAFGKIVAAGSPGEAKALGRAVKNFDEEKWNANRFEIVVNAALEKFGQNEALGAFLQSTGSLVLVEASPQDRIWGIGLAADNPKAQNPKEWDGLNLLGFALMEARTRLAAA